MQSYHTLGGPAEASVTEKKSEFIASAAPAATEEEALAFLEKIRAGHRTASHNVYAYSLRENARRRYSDDGEPQKTAGLPVLEVITHKPVEDCIIVVTRYFGGTLLGTGGLVRAYTAAAQAVLQQAEILTVRLCISLTLAIEYPLLETALRLFADTGAKLDEPLYAEAVTLCAVLPAGAEAALLPKLDALCRGQANVTVGTPFYTPF